MLTTGQGPALFKGRGSLTFVVVLTIVRDRKGSFENKSQPRGIVIGIVNKLCILISHKV